MYSEKLSNPDSNRPLNCNWLNSVYLTVKHRKYICQPMFHELLLKIHFFSVKYTDHRGANGDKTYSTLNSQYCVLNYCLQSCFVKKTVYRY